MSWGASRYVHTYLALTRSGSQSVTRTLRPCHVEVSRLTGYVQVVLTVRKV